MRTLREVLWIAGLIALGLYISYLSAGWGHPTAVWLWRDILHVYP